MINPIFGTEVHRHLRDAPNRVWARRYCFSNLFFVAQFFKSHLFEVGRNKLIYGIPIFLPEVQTEIKS